MTTTTKKETTKKTTTRKSASKKTTGKPEMDSFKRYGVEIIDESTDKPENLEKVKTEIVNPNQTKFPEFLKDSPAVEILDNEKLAKRLATTTEFIRKEVGNVAKSFCRIGFKLWEAKEEKLYLGEGFKNVYEYGERVLGFQKSSVKNYISICERFSVRKNDKPTSQLLPDFASFSYGQLSLMLSVPDEKLTEITPDATCKQIRDMKNAAKSESSGDTENDETSGESSEPVSKTYVPMFTRMLTDDNIELAIKLLRENIGHEIRISIYGI